jgi:hypothetical protein
MVTGYGVGQPTSHNPVSGPFMHQVMMSQQDQTGHQAGYHTGYQAMGEFPGQQMDLIEADIEPPRSGGFSILSGGSIYPHPQEMGRNTPAGDGLALKLLIHYKYNLRSNNFGKRHYENPNGAFQVSHSARNNVEPSLHTWNLVKLILNYILN